MESSCAVCSSASVNASIRSSVNRICGPAITTAPVTSFVLKWRIGAAVEFIQGVYICMQMLVPRLRVWRRYLSSAGQLSGARGP